jgi:hypothetical protein
MFPLFAILGGLANIGGLGLSFLGMSQANQAAKKQQQLEMRAEDVRSRQMQLEAQRQRRQVIRQSMAKAAQAEAMATNQGAEKGSALAGVESGITNQAGQALQGINSSVENAKTMFGINAEISRARLDQAQGNQTAQLGSGLSSLGGNLMQNSGTFNKLIGLF